MSTTLILVGLISVLIGILFGLAGYYFYRQMLDDKKGSAADKEADRIINRAKSQCSKIEREAKHRAKDFEARARKNVESDIRKKKMQIQNTESQMKDKESRLEKDFKRKQGELESKLGELKDREERARIQEVRIKETEKDVVQFNNRLKEKLESVAGMSSDQAREELRKTIENEARREASERMTEIEEEVRKEAEKKSRRILASALARFASEVATEKTVSLIALTSDEMKGKIIGREGRNIKALEAACGVDLIIDETPESVVISCFDPVRREVARLTLEKLMEDGRVHPARIEDVVEKVKADFFTTIHEFGEKACLDLGVLSVHSNLMSLIGQMKFRHLESQNLYEYSLEVAYIAGLLAGEIGADVKAARRVGLLHSIGKVIDHSAVGSFAQVGADFAKRHGERDIIVKAILRQDDDQQAESVLDHLLQAAINLVIARPGVKRNMLENYIKRLSDLESIGNSFDGVSRTYAIQAGKEIRVMVDSGKVTDEQSQMLTRDIASKIERELSYPGHVKVMVVRETRIIEHAR